MKLKCDKCDREWDYKGKNRVKATCPDCRKLVHIKGGKKR